MSPPAATPVTSLDSLVAAHPDSLGELFAAGRATDPAELGDAPRGRVLAFAHGAEVFLVFRPLLRALGSGLMPWRGKTFDHGGNSGQNVLASAAARSASRPRSPPRSGMAARPWRSPTTPLRTVTPGPSTPSATSCAPSAPAWPSGRRSSSPRRGAPRFRCSGSAWRALPVRGDRVRVDRRATGLLHSRCVAEDRPGPRPFPTDRAGPDPPESAEIHLAGRAHRAQGQGPRVHPDPPDRHPPLPLRRQAAGRRRSGRRQARATRWAAARRSSPGRARRAASRATTSSRSTSPSTSWPPSSARSSSSPTSRTRARARSRAPTTATPASAASGRSRSATSSAPTARRSSG